VTNIEPHQASAAKTAGIESCRLLQSENPEQLQLLQNSVSSCLASRAAVRRAAIHLKELSDSTAGPHMDWRKDRLSQGETAVGSLPTAPRGRPFVMVLSPCVKPEN
jgi:hypothetical protein